MTKGRREVSLAIRHHVQTVHTSFLMLIAVDPETRRHLAICLMARLSEPLAHSLTDTQDTTEPGRQQRDY